VGVVYPWAWLGSVYAVWAIAGLVIGRWPRPLLDDPKTLGGWVNLPHTVSVLILALAMPALGTSVAAALTLGFSRKMKWSAAFSWLSALLLSWTLAVGLARLDPGRVIAWFVD
jgi:hypothetical protein